MDPVVADVLKIAFQTLGIILTSFFGVLVARRVGVVHTLVNSRATKQDTELKEQRIDNASLAAQVKSLNEIVAALVASGKTTPPHA